MAILIVRLLNVILSLAGLVGVLGSFILWFVILVQVIKRQDLKESKILWVLLLLFAAPIGMIAYPFVENRKKLGIATIIILALPVVTMILFAVTRFALAAAL